MAHLVLLSHGPVEEEASDRGATVTVLPFEWQGSKMRSLKLICQSMLQFRRLLLIHRPEFLISYTFTDFVLASIPARLLRYPVVYRAQGEMFPPGSKHPKTWLGPWLIPFMRVVRPLVVCTTRTEARAMRKAGIPASLIRQIYLGVNRKRFQQFDAPSGGAFDSPVKRPVVAMFGRLVQWKGQDIFLKALGILKRRGQAFRAWIVGSGEFGDGQRYENLLRNLVEEEGLNADVEFLGFRRDVPQLMAGCDIVCHASHREPFGMVIAEAMMAGRPVVATDVIGPRESVLDGETGLLVPPGNSVALADALQRLLADPVLRSEMGRRGRERALELFDLEKNLGLLDEECDRLLIARSGAKR